MTDFYSTIINNSIKKATEEKSHPIDATAAMIIAQTEEALKKRDDPERAKQLNVR